MDINVAYSIVREREKYGLNLDRTGGTDDRTRFYIQLMWIDMGYVFFFPLLGLYVTN